MKRSILLLLLIGIFLSFLGCVSEEIQEDYDASAQSTLSTKSQDPSLLEESITYEPYVLESGDYYQITKLSLSDYAYEICNSEGVVIKSEIFHGNVPPTIENLGDNILAIEFYYGPGVREFIFCDLGTEIFSDRYQGVLKYDAEKVVYLSGDSETQYVIVHGLFDSSKDRKETVVDSALVATSVISAEYLKNGTQLKIQYRRSNTDELGIVIIDMP